VDFPHLKSQKGPVLITGHTGFKGAWLSLLLNRLGIKHHGFAFEAEINSLFQRADLASFVPTTIGDIRDLNQVSNCFKQVHPSTVIHTSCPKILRKAP
jgi:CDP-glucose 4,6-dehydratase